MGRRQKGEQKSSDDGPEGVVRNQRRDDGYDEQDRENEGAEDVEVFVPAAEDAAQSFYRRRMVADLVVEEGYAFGEEVVADVLDAARVAGIVVGGAARLVCEFERDLSRLDFAGIGALGEFGDAHVIGVAGLVFHVGEDVRGVLTEDCVEGDQGLEHSAPFELVEAPHAVEDC